MAIILKYNNLPVVAIITVFNLLKSNLLLFFVPFLKFEYCGTPSPYEISDTYDCVRACAFAYISKLTHVAKECPSLFMSVMVNSAGVSRICVWWPCLSNQMQVLVSTIWSWRVLMLPLVTSRRYLKG